MKTIENVAERLKKKVSGNNFSSGTLSRCDNLLSGLLYSLIFILNVEIEYLIVISLVAGAYSVHNNPVMCLVSSLFLLTIISFQMGPGVSSGVGLCVLLTMCSLLTFINPWGILTFLYPLAVMRDDMIREKVEDGEPESFFKSLFFPN